MQDASILWAVTKIIIIIIIIRFSIGNEGFSFYDQ